jgi:hypothetical protein
MSKITSTKTANGEMEWVISEELTIAKAVSFTRPANTTAYTAKDVVNVALTVTGATNASPIVLTTGTHGLADGDPVTVASVGGNTNANGNFFAKVTGYSSTTFALYSDKALTTPVAGNSAYTSGGTVARLFRLKDIFSDNGGSGLISKVLVRTNLSTCVEQFKIHFYSAPITALVDNSVFTLLFANAPAHLGAVTMPAMTTEGTGSDSAMSMATPGDATSELPLAVRNTDGTKDLYFRIEDLTAGTPASGQSYYVEVSVMEG